MVVGAGGYSDGSIGPSIVGDDFLQRVRESIRTTPVTSNSGYRIGTSRAISGIGEQRSPGDVDDPRRGLGPVPQSQSVIGLPSPVERISAAEPFSGYETLPGESSTSSNAGKISPYRDQGQDMPRRGFGSGGGMFIGSPQGQNGQRRTMLRGENGESIPTDATRYRKAPYFTNYQRSRSSTPAVDRSRVARSEPVMPELRGQTSQFTQQGPTAAPQVGDAELLAGYEFEISEPAIERAMANAPNLDRESAIALLRSDATRVNETDVVQTSSGKKQRGRLLQDDLTPHSRGSFIDPSLASTPEISPYSTIEVPVRGRDGQVTSTKTIDPQAVAVTRTGDLDDIHMSASTDEVSIAKRASELKTAHRTPLISGTDVNAMVQQGTARRPNADEQDRNLAGFIQRGGQEVPIYRTNLDKNTDQGPVAMYRVGAPNNTNWNAMRDEANPRYKEEGGGPFDTQVVRQPKSRAGLRRQIDDVISGAAAKGSTVYAINPQTNKREAIAEEGDIKGSDFYVESADGSQKTHLLVERDEPKTIMGRVVEQGTPTGRAILASGAGRPQETVVETGPTPFLNRDDVYEKVGGIRRNVEKQVARDPDLEGAMARLDEVMGSLADSGFMESPDTVNVTRKMASAVLQGQMDPGAVPESIRREVSAELRAMQGQGREVLLTQEPSREGPVLADPVAATAAAARGPVKAFIDRPQTSMSGDQTELGGYVGQDVNTDGDGELVQSAYGQFGENRGDDPGFNRGFSTKQSAIFRTPEREALIDGVKASIAAKLGLPESRSMDSQIESLTPLVLRNMDQGDSLESAVSQFTGGNVRTIQGPMQGPRRQAPNSQLAVAQILNNQAVAEEGSPLPQSTGQGVVNTDRVSQINAPAPTGQIADPAMGAQLDTREFLQQNVSAGNIQQAAADNVVRGLAPGASSATQNAANQLLADFRRRFG